MTAEAGVTCARLKAALDPLDLRTPFFGPFSGIAGIDRESTMAAARQIMVSQTSATSSSTA